MGKPTGFTEFTRQLPPDRDPALRILDWDEFHEHLDEGSCETRGPAAWTAASRSATRAT